jgi:hypothetical protein
MNRSAVPQGMSRRHFLSHLAGATALATPATSFLTSLQAAAPDLKKRNKSAILLWMGGGPATIDLWDLKPGAPTGGSFRPISTAGEGQICEHLSKLAPLMDKLTIVRSMSTREADHDRGRYYMHTGYAPNPSIEHPSYGAVVAHELMESRGGSLQIPPFISVGGGSVGPGFLGMTYAPFVVGSDGDVKNLEMGLGYERLMQRMQALNLIEKQFVGQNRGSAATDHEKVLRKTLELLTSQQMAAFKLDGESTQVRERYGRTGFGDGCLLARRLVEVGTPFVEVDLGGWDTHSNNFTDLARKLPEMDQAMSALVGDLAERGLLQDTAIIWMGEFGRTPRINGDAGRDHWARSWSVVVGGAGFKGGKVIGQTSADGTEVESEPYSSEDLMASVLKSLDIPLTTTFQSRSGRPMKIANSGKVIGELFG